MTNHELVETGLRLYAPLDVQRPLAELVLGKRALKGDFREALRDALLDGNVLGKALCTLSPEALRALGVLVDQGEMLPIEEARRIVAPHTGPRLEQALQELSSCSLFLSSGGPCPRVGLPHWLLAPLLSVVPSPFAAVEVSSEESDPRFVEAVQAAVFAGARVRVNANGWQINQVDIRKVEKQLAKSPQVIRRMDGALDGLSRLRVLGTRGGRVRLNVNAARRYFALPVAEALSHKAVLGGTSLARAWAVLALASPRALPIAALQQALGAGGRTDASLARVIEVLELSVVTVDGQRYVKAPCEVARASRPTLVVQPSFDVLVPPETPLAVIAELGCWAELVQADRFATFRLTEASVRAAEVEGRSPRSLHELLERHAAHGVPQNVTATLAGWTQGEAPSRAIEGTAIFIEDRALLARAVAQLAEVAIKCIRLGDQVLVVPSFDDRRACKVLRKLGVPVGNPETASEAGALVPDEELVTPRGQRLLADELRTALQERVRAPSSTQVTARPQREDLEGMLESARARRLAVRLSARGVVHEGIIDRLSKHGTTTYIEMTTCDGEAHAIRVDELESLEPARNSAAKKATRNEPCPCGSGRKFKKCCLMQARA